MTNDKQIVPKDTAPVNVPKAQIVTIDRQKASDPFFFSEDKPSNFLCWLRAWDGEPGNSEELENEVFHYKKDAIAWAKKHLPGVRISYVTDCGRVAAATTGGHDGA